MRFILLTIAVLSFGHFACAQDAQPTLQQVLQATLDQMAQAEAEQKLKLEALHVHGTQSAQTTRQARPSQDASQGQPSK